MTTGTEKTVKRCGCGRRMSRYSNLCRACHEAHMRDLHDRAQAVVASGKCPDCGAGLHRNLALTGWWQCDRFPTSKGGCGFQGFTE